MIIKFKKAHSLSDKIYISFGEKDENGKDVYIEFPIHRDGIEDVVFGPADSENKPLIDFLSSPATEGTEGATPASLSDIKIFGQNKDEIWVPNYSKQQFLAYLNEKPDTVYIDFSQGENQNSNWPYSELGDKKSLKFFNINSDDIYLSNFKRIIENGSGLDLGATVLPKKENYDGFFQGVSSIEYGAELPDDTVSAIDMYAGTHIKRPINLYGNIERADRIFQNCSGISELPKYWGNKLKSLESAFMSTNIEGDLSSVVNLPKSLENMSSVFANTNITKSPLIPRNVSDLSYAFQNSKIRVLPQFEDRDNDVLVNLDNAFSRCYDFGASLTEYIGNLPNFIYSLNRSFEFCINLKEFYIHFPNSLISAKQTFSGCTLLTEPPIFNENLEDIDGIFENCTVLKCPRSDKSIISIPKSLITMRNSFENTGIEVTPDMSNARNLSDISGAFYGCYNLKKVNDIYLSAPITSILNAFTPNGNYIIEEFPSIPYNVQDNFDFAFSYGESGQSTLNKNNRLQRFGNIYSNVNSLNGTFRGASNLSSIGTIRLGNVTSNFALCDTFNGCDGLINSPAISIRQGTPKADRLFKNCRHLENIVNIPRATSYNEAFYNCQNLHGKKLASYKNDFGTRPGEIKYTPFPYFDEIEESVLRDNNFNGVSVENAFIGDTGLVEISFPRYAKRPQDICDSPLPVQIVKGLPDSKYTSSSDIQTLFSRTLHNSTKVIESIPKSYTDNNNWFTNITSLVSCGIYEDSDVISMEKTFKGCTSLKNTKVFSLDEICKKIANEEDDIANEYKEDDARDGEYVEIVLPQNVTNIDSAFEGCSSLKKVNTIYEKVSTAKSAFKGCSSLEKIDNIKAVGPSTRRNYNTENDSQFQNAFSNCGSLEEIGQIGKLDQRAPDLGGSGLSVLKKIGMIFGKDISNVFNFPTSMPNNSIGSVMPDTQTRYSVPVNYEVEDMYAAFRNCKALQVVDFCKTKDGNSIYEALNSTEKNNRVIEIIRSNSIPYHVKNLDYTFMNTGIWIDEGNYEDFFEKNIETGKDSNGKPIIENWTYHPSVDDNKEALVSTFEGCNNIYIMPTLPDYSEAEIPQLTRTFANCSNLHTISLNTGVRYGKAWGKKDLNEVIPDSILNSGTFNGSSNISRCEIVPAGVNLEIYSFKGCNNLTTIGTLYQNWGYSLSAVEYNTEVETDDLVTEEGRYYQQITGIDVQTNSFTERYESYDSAELSYHISVMKSQYGNDNVRVIEHRAPYTVWQDNFGHIIKTSSDENSNYHTGYNITYEMPGYVILEITTGTTTTPIYQALGDYLEVLKERGLIKETQTIITTTIASFISSYFSEIGLYFQNLKYVEKIGAPNSCGILATGKLLKTDINGTLIEEESNVIVGPQYLERVGTDNINEYITTKDVSNLSHAFENAPKLKQVGSIPSTVTAIQTPFKGCKMLESIGNIEANSDDYESLCQGVESLLTIGNLGCRNGISKNLDNAFNGCKNLTHVGKIQKTFHSFTGTFRDCQRLQQIDFLSYYSLVEATGSEDEYGGYGYEVGGGYGAGVTLTENPYGDIIGMFAGARSGIRIYTDNPTRMREFFINWASTLRDISNIKTETRYHTERMPVPRMHVGPDGHVWTEYEYQWVRVAEEVEVPNEAEIQAAKDWARSIQFIDIEQV